MLGCSSVQRGEGGGFVAVSEKKKKMVGWLVGLQTTTERHKLSLYFQQIMEY